MTTTTKPCLKCRTETAGDAIRCPECEYEPRQIGANARTAIGLVGAGLTMTVIGAVIGLPMLAAAHYNGYMAENRRPTTHEP